MDFGDILDQWENRKKPESREMKKYIDIYLPDHNVKKEKESNQNENPSTMSRAERLNIPPQRTLDLHGMRLKEAIIAVDLFIKKCKKDGVRKVLIIHGKGNHSTEPAVLGKKVQEFIRKSSLTGEWGIADKKYGGRGALWVFIRP